MTIGKANVLINPGLDGIRPLALLVGTNAPSLFVVNKFLSETM